MLGLQSFPLFSSSVLVTQLCAMVDLTASSPSRAVNSMVLESTPPTTQLPLPSEPAESQRSALQTSPPRQRRRMRRIRRPAKNSLYDLFHQHAGTSLFLRPICWTDLHTRLLGANFTELAPCSTPLPVVVPGSPPSKGHMRPSQTIIRLGDALSDILLPTSPRPGHQCNAIRTILSTLWPVAFNQPQILSELHIFFGDRVYRDAVLSQITWNYPPPTLQSSQMTSFRSVSTRPATDSYYTPPPSPDTHNPVGLPMVCYVGKNQLANIRKHAFRIVSGPGQNRNEPVMRLQKMRAKMLEPANSDHDSHFVAIFLAMAQRHFYGAPPRSSQRDSRWLPARDKRSCPNFHDIKLRVMTHDNGTAEFIVYTGYITKGFLERFHDPFGAPDDADDANDSTPGIQIEYTRVPIWPILGLRERLGKALGEEITGQFDANEMETWEDDAPENEDTTPKRKREALSEVFNESYHESDDEKAAHDSKKRRLSGNVSVGVAA